MKNAATITISPADFDHVYDALRDAERVYDHWQVSHLTTEAEKELARIKGDALARVRGMLDACEIMAGA